MAVKSQLFMALSPTSVFTCGFLPDRTVILMVSNAVGTPIASSVWVMSFCSPSRRRCCRAGPLLGGLWRLCRSVTKSSLNVTQNAFSQGIGCHIRVDRGVLQPFHSTCLRFRGCLMCRLSPLKSFWDVLPQRLFLTHSRFCFIFLLQGSDFKAICYLFRYLMRFISSNHQCARYLTDIRPIPALRCSLSRSLREPRLAFLAFTSPPI